MEVFIVTYNAQGYKSVVAVFDNYKSAYDFAISHYPGYTTYESISICCEIVSMPMAISVPAK